MTAAIAMPGVSYAYTCSSGQYGNDGDFVCFRMVKDQNRGKPQGPTDANGNVINPKCGVGEVLDGGSCWTMKRENTAEVPKNNDGTTVDKGSYGCEAGYAYNSAKHRCINEAGEEKNPIEMKPDTTKKPESNNNSSGGSGGSGGGSGGTVVPRPNTPGTGSASGDAKEGTCGKDNQVRYVLIPCVGQGAPAIASVLKYFVGILSLGVGIVAVGGIAYGAILYAGARDSSSQTTQAINTIRTVLIGVILYVLMVALLGWLVPGIWS